MSKSITNDDGKVFDAVEIKETFIFANAGGNITIKQSCGYCDEDDIIVIIPSGEIENVIKALRRAKIDLKV